MDIEFETPDNYLAVLARVLEFRASIGRSEALLVATTDRVKPE